MTGHRFLGGAAIQQILRDGAVIQQEMAGLGMLRLGQDWHRHG